MAGKMGKTNSAPVTAEPCLHRFHQIDLRDWLFWLDAARELAVAAGREHRRLHTISSEGLTWHALRDEPLFRAAKALYLQTESETVRGVATHAR